MENLNAEQIKKALECLNDKHDRECVKCPIYKLTGRGHSSCRHIILDAALALINSQEQRIKELTEDNEQFRYDERKLIEQRDTFREYAEKMQLFVENIKHKEEEGYEPSAARYAAEMEMWHVVALEKQKLTEENEKIGIENFNLICELSRIKADTVRKMQERLKQQVFSDATPHDYELLCCFIDGVAEELLEGDDG